MKTSIIVTAFVLVSVSPLPAAVPPKSPEILVGTAWVAERLSDPRLVLFHVGDRKEYDSLHLPRAQFLPLRDIAEPFVEGALSLQLPEAARMDSVLEARGVTDSSIIVIYPGGEWYTPTARAWLTFEQFGLGGRARLMDGGMRAWIQEGRAVTSDTSAAPPSKGSMTLHPRTDVVVGKDWVFGHLKDPAVAVIDARNPQFYTGQDTGNASRPGRLPGARNIPFDTLIDSAGYYRKPAAIRALFEAQGVSEGRTVVSYCHVGQQASLVYVMARLLGFEARMYDGSMQEWTRDPEMPVERDPAPPPQR